MSPNRPHSPTRRLVVITRYPEPGRAKTRLIPALGPEGAASFHARMTENTIRAVRPATERMNALLEVRYVGATRAAMEGWLGRDLLLVPQGEGDLGARMGRAIAEGLRAGDESVVIVGCDLPELRGEIIEHAFDALESSDVVFGPAVDGGYYLVGISARTTEEAFESLFDGIDWGTSRVLEQSRRAAEAEELAVTLVETLADVDTPEDLRAWERAQEGCSPS